MTYTQKQRKCVGLTKATKAGVKNEGCQEEKMNYFMLS